MSGSPSPFMSSVVTPSAWSVPRRCTKKVTCGTPPGPGPGAVLRSGLGAWAGARIAAANADSKNALAARRNVCEVMNEAPCCGELLWHPTLNAEIAFRVGHPLSGKKWVEVRAFPHLRI